jgi:hypothetical protein
VHVPADDPGVVEVTRAVQEGDLDGLRRVLDGRPELVTARFGVPDRSRTILHVATDWPGHFPDGPAVVRLLVERGADVNARFVGGPNGHTETPLHWAASSDDVAVLDTLLDLGADIEADGSVLGGGPPLSDAVGFGQWAAARRLVERGARTRLPDAAALGMLDRLHELLEDPPVPGDVAGPPGRPATVVTRALWNACNGGQWAAAQLLVEHGADVNWVGWDDLAPLDLAERHEAADLAAWLRHHGARTAADQRP